MTPYKFTKKSFNRIAKKILVDAVMNEVTAYMEDRSHSKDAGEIQAELDSIAGDILNLLAV